MKSFSDAILPKCGPKKASHPSIGELCPVCQKPFQEGDYTTFVPMGPGDDPENQRACREGRGYNAIALEAHYACITGESHP